jgi:hypothetical protein
MITLTISTLDGNVRETSLPSFNNLEAKDWTENNRNRLKEKEWFIFYEGDKVVYKVTYGSKPIIGIAKIRVPNDLLLKK